MIYELDYKNGKDDSECCQMFLDFGWEPCGECFGCLYYRKPAATVTTDSDREIFSDLSTVRALCIFACALQKKLGKIKKTLTKSIKF